MIHPNCSEIVVRTGVRGIEEIKSLLKQIIEETNLALIIRASCLTYSEIPLCKTRRIIEVVSEVSPDDIEIFNHCGDKAIGVKINKLPEKARRTISSWSSCGNYTTVRLIDKKSKGQIFMSYTDECLKLWISDGDINSYEAFAKICRICSSFPYSSGGSLGMFEEWCRNNGYDD